MKKNIIKIGGLVGLLLAIGQNCYATCTTNIAECITIPSWADFSAANGDWVEGMFGLFQTPLFFGAALLLTVGVIAFVVSLISRAVAHMHG